MRHKRFQTIRSRSIRINPLRGTAGSGRDLPAMSSLAPGGRRRAGGGAGFQRSPHLRGPQSTGSHPSDRDSADHRCTGGCRLLRGRKPMLFALPSPPDPFAAAAATLTEENLRAGEDPTAVGGEVYDSVGRPPIRSGSYWSFSPWTGPSGPPSLKRWLPGVNLPEETDASDTAFPIWNRCEPCGLSPWETGAGGQWWPSDGAANRLPTQSVEVVVDLGAGTPAMVDLPRFIPFPEATASQWWVGEEWETPPTAVLKIAREEFLLAEAGTVAGQPAFSRMGDVWRVEWAVIDAAGISWPVSLWMGPGRGAPSP